MTIVVFYHMKLPVLLKLQSEYLSIVPVQDSPVVQASVGDPQHEGDGQRNPPGQGGGKVLGRRRGSQKTS